MGRDRVPGERDADAQSFAGLPGDASNASAYRRVTSVGTARRETGVRRPFALRLALLMSPLLLVPAAAFELGAFQTRHAVDGSLGTAEEQLVALSEQAERLTEITREERLGVLRERLAAASSDARNALHASLRDVAGDLRLALADDALTGLLPGSSRKDRNEAFAVLNSRAAAVVQTHAIDALYLTDPSGKIGAVWPLGWREAGGTRRVKASSKDLEERRFLADLEQQLAAGFDSATAVGEVDLPVVDEKGETQGRIERVFAVAVPFHRFEDDRILAQPGGEPVARAIALIQPARVMHALGALQREAGSCVLRASDGTVLLSGLTGSALPATLPDVSESVEVRLHPRRDERMTLLTIEAWIDASAVGQSLVALQSFSERNATTVACLREDWTGLGGVLEKNRATHRWVVLFGCVLGLVIAALAARALGRRVRRLADAAERIGVDTGLQLQDADRKASDELGVLARRLESVDEVLLARTHALSRYTASLEEEVAARTQDLEVRNTELESHNEELEIAREQALAAAAAKSAFLANMSHELRTPMHGVLGLAELLREHVDGPQGTELLEEQQACGDHLLGVINDVLDVSKLEADEVVFERAPFPVEQLFAGPLSAAARKARGKGIGFECEVASGVPEVLMGDVARLRQVLINFTGNAIKFTDEGQVTIVVKRVAERDAGRDLGLRLEVRDTGPGIAPDRQAAIFAPFSQEDASTNRRFGGTGLGLSIAKKLIEGMGGAVGLDSVVGSGSVFWAELAIPAPTAKELAEHEATLLREQSRPARPLRLLMAEDNPINQRVASSLLTRNGHTVVVAENGRLALDMLDSADKPFDAVLMDIHMPVLDGYETTATFRASEAEGEHLPILGLTANAEQEVVQRCLAAGMDAHLAKPFREEELLGALAELCERRYGPRRSNDERHAAAEAPSVTAAEQLPRDEVPG